MDQGINMLPNEVLHQVFAVLYQNGRAPRSVGRVSRIYQYLAMTFPILPLNETNAIQNIEKRANDASIGKKKRKHCKIDDIHENEIKAINESIYLNKVMDKIDEYTMHNCRRKIFRSGYQENKDTYHEKVRELISDNFIRGNSLSTKGLQEKLLDVGKSPEDFFKMFSNGIEYINKNKVKEGHISAYNFPLIIKLSAERR